MGPSASGVSDPESALPAGAIAVVGMACRLPGADTPEALWRNLRDGRESITAFSEEALRAAGVSAAEADQPGYVAAKGVIRDADTFDAGFFGFSPREAALMDPQQRVFLECAWTALEDAGYDSHDVDAPIGVFAGSILSIYLVKHLWPNRELVEGAGTFQTAVGNDPTFLATGVAYQLDLRGPSVSVGTACSTSLVAVHLACQSLLAFESDMALAGGVSVHLPLVGGYRYEDGGILSPDGHCRPFDAAAAGTVSSDGAGVVVLKRLDDALRDGDLVHAVIRGSAMNNDGRQKVGYTAPSVEGESRAIVEALAMADVVPESISMVETHGAGTLLGDPIEVAALVEAFGDCGGRQGFCALSSIKSNIGHVDAAAGIAGLIKAVLAVRERAIPPTLHFANANPQIDLETSPFYVNNQLIPVVDSTQPMRAGVSSFGIGGTNVHMVVEEPPPPVVSDVVTTDSASRPYELLVLSARTPSALDAATDRLADRIEQDETINLADVGFTLRRGRRAFDQRRIVVCRDREQAIEALRERDSRRLMSAAVPSARVTVTFMFPGLGDHYPRMGWEIYCTEPVFRNVVDRCAEILRAHLDGDIRDFLYPERDWSHPSLEETAPSAPSTEGATLDFRAMIEKARAGAATDRAAGGADVPDADRPAAAQPGIFVTEVALAGLLSSWGFVPEALIGHSIGELAAAHIAGVMSLEDSLRLVAARARLIQERVAPGAMLAVPLDEATLRDRLPEGVSVGVVNGERLCVASGTRAGVDTLAESLEADGISCQRLRSTHAYHSSMMDVLAEPLTAVLQSVTLTAPRIPYVSGMTGTWITAEEATDRGYWARHLCGTVRFHQGLSTLLDDSDRLLVEVGPGQGLTSHAIGERARVAERENPVVPTMRWSYDRQSELAVLLLGVGQLWLAGIRFDRARFLARDGARRVQLPTYPFERQRYWIEPPTAGAAGVDAAPTGKQADVADWFYLPFWKPAPRVAAWSPAPWPRGPQPRGPQPRGPQPRAQDDAAGAVLVFVDRLGVGSAIASALVADGHRVTTVEPGDVFSAAGDVFTVDPRQTDDYARLVRALVAADRAPTTVIHLWSLTREEAVVPSGARFAALQEMGFLSLVRLVRAMVGERLVGEGLDMTVHLQVVANGLVEVDAGDRLVPEKATLRGPAMVAPQEHPGLTCRVVDVDVSTGEGAEADGVIELLLDEISVDGGPSLIALRRGRRWVAAYEKIRLETVDPTRMPFREGGVYLLTGGLGGVGLVLAEYLAHTVQARLVLVGRSAFPAPEDWQAWRDEHDVDDLTSVKVARLMAIEAAGAEVLTLQADVADVEAMTRVVGTAERHFGPLNGVIHGAGAVGMETFCELGQTSAAHAESQFVAKAHGVLVLDKVLDQVLGERELDFCLLMSSLSAVLGGLGFGAYGAANVFMDTFALWRNRRNRGGGTRWTSIDWDSWLLGDTQPVIEGLGATVSAFNMAPDEGAEALMRILAEGNLDQVVVSSGDLQARLRQWVERDSERGPADGPVTLHDRPSLATSYKAPRGELEASIAAIWQELFGVTEVGVHDNFFELGGHSLLATQLNARLVAQLGVEMSLASLLQAPTIAELAVAVVDLQAEQADPEMLERLLAEIGDEA